MAPTSTSRTKSSLLSSQKRKKGSTTTRPSKTTNTKMTTGTRRQPQSKLVVRKQNRNHNNIDSEGKTIEIPTLPSSWPVSSRPPPLLSSSSTTTTVSALAPGSLLRQRCSGQDVHLAKTAAMTTPIITKEKGKFLLVFPGNFSFHKPLPSPTLNASADKENDDTDNNNNFDKTDKDTDGDDDIQPVAIAASSTTTNTTPVSVSKLTNANNNNSNNNAIWGRLEGLATDTPTFRIPFCNINKRLVFQGKQIPTTSKYLVLSCVNNNKNTTTLTTAKPKMVVQCKAIFSSVIVFDTPKWESLPKEEVKEEEKGQYGDDVVIASQDDDNEEKIVPTESTKSHFLSHYGGSDRTVDGITRGQTNKKKARNSSSNTAETPACPTTQIIPIITKKGIHKTTTTTTTSSMFHFPDVEEDQEMVNENNNNHDTKSSTTSKLQTIDWDSDSDSDASFELPLVQNTNNLASSTKTRQAPKRQASLKRKRYTVELEEEDDDIDEDDNGGSSGGSSNNNDDGSDVVELVSPPMKDSIVKQVNQSAGAIAPTRTSTSTRKRTITKQYTTSSKEGVVDLFDSSDMETAPTLRTSMKGKRKTAIKGKQSSVEMDSDSSSIEINHNGIPSDEESEMDKGNPKPKNKKSNRKLVDGKETTSNSSESAVITKLTNPPRRRSAPRRCASLPKKVYAESDDDDSLTNDDQKIHNSNDETSMKEVDMSTKAKRKARKQEGDMPTSNHSLSQSPLPKSPFRKRRKKQSPGKVLGNSPAVKILDLTGDDDEFIFG